MIKRDRESGQNLLQPSSANERKNNVFTSSHDKKGYYADRALDHSKDIFLSKDSSTRVDYNLKVSYQDSAFTPKMAELRNA